MFLNCNYYAMYHVPQQQKKKQHSPKLSSGLCSGLGLEQKHKDGSSELPVRARDPTGLPRGPGALPARVPFFSLDWSLLGAKLEQQTLAAAARPQTGVAYTGASRTREAGGRWFPYLAEQLPGLRTLRWSRDL